METSKSAEEDQGWHLQLYAKLESKRSRMALLGCVAFIIAIISYTALASPPTYGPRFELPPQIRSFLSPPPADRHEASSPKEYERRVKEVFERAAMPNKTVIITTLNAAWAQEDSMIDMFLESFWQGDGTRRLLQHLVIVCIDEKAYQRCLVIHPHCIYIKTPGVNFSGDQLVISSEGYNKLTWRKIKFLKMVLEMNYNFVYTDADVLWFRDPFPRLQSDTHADFQLACDHYNGKPSDVRNAPNTGFKYVRANERTIRFYDYWYEERKRDPNMNDQEMFNAIKFDNAFTSLGMKIHFLDTQFFGGFCGLKNTDMTKAITMHATCCKGIKAKLIDLRMILEGWKKWHAQHYTLIMVTTQKKESDGTLHSKSANQLALLPTHNVQAVDSDPHFQVPLACPQSWHKH